MSSKSPSGPDATTTAGMHASSSTLLIRADASAEVGTGHVMRCLALAQAWMDRGGHAAFVMADPLPEMVDRLEAERIEVHTLTAGKALDPAAAIGAARAMDAAWIVVDGYAFTSTYLAALKGAGLRLLWIDDDARATPYCVDLVLNQNLHAQADHYHRCSPSTQVLLGPSFALLRREFTCHRPSRAFADSPGRLLVTMGGSDPTGETSKVLNALPAIVPQHPDLHIDLVIGAANASGERLERRAQMLAQVTVHRAASDMAALMAEADLAVSAGGSTNWELAYFGVPTLTVSVAPNQVPITEALDTLGVSQHLGWHEQVTSVHIAEALQRLLGDAERRRAMHERGQALVDGQGAARVVQAMTED